MRKPPCTTPKARSIVVVQVTSRGHGSRLWRSLVERHHYRTVQNQAQDDFKGRSDFCWAVFDGGQMCSRRCAIPLVSESDTQIRETGDKTGRRRSSASCPLAGARARPSRSPEMACWPAQRRHVGRCRKCPAKAGIFRRPTANTAASTVVCSLCTTQ
ncbi:hypothetical protein BKA80DRAFT_274698 [Phyllosticta citrichinensis]